MIQKKFKTNSNTYQSIICHARPNDIEENSKVKYREVYCLFYSFVSFICNLLQKPINKENEATDWSFDNEEALDYDIQFNDVIISQNLIVKEVTHTYM